MEPDKILVENIFITGATGCIGRYVVEQLLNNEKYHLFLLIRGGEKKADTQVLNANNVSILSGGFCDIDKYKQELQQSDYVINIATSWGGHVANADNVVNMLSLVDPKRLKKFIQFETASILGRGNVLLEEAKTEGTGYVKCKYDIYHITKNHKLSDKIIRVYPTVVIGGAKDRPYSHISKGLINLKKHLNLLKHFYIDFGFHYMHTEDIAKCVIHIMENIDNEHDLVLGNDYITLKDFLKQAVLFYDKKAIFRIKIPSWFIFGVITIFRIKVSPWDRFCFEYKWFKYKVVNCKTYGIRTNKYTVEDIFVDLEENRG